MAPPSASFTALLCILLLVTLSSARTPHDQQPSNTNHDSFSDSDTIFLPSDKSESESLTQIELEPQITKPDVEAVESTESSSDDPIKVINFRPLNHHIPRRPLPLTFRFGHRCRHNHEFKPRRQIPYGNDMILSNDKHQSFDLLPRDEVRQIPIRWTRFRHAHPWFSHQNGMDSSEIMKRLHHHHHHHEHEHEHDHDFRGFMKGIRKFLPHF